MKGDRLTARRKPKPDAACIKGDAEPLLGRSELVAIKQARRAILAGVDAELAEDDQ